MNVTYGPIGAVIERERIARAAASRAGLPCGQLVVRSVLTNGTAARARVVAGMALVQLDRWAAAALEVREVQRRLLAASPESPVALRFVGAAQAAAAAEAGCAGLAPGRSGG